jgi:hypothetical protein
MAKLPEKSQQIVQSHAVLIVMVVRVCQNPQLMPELEPMLQHALSNNWTDLVGRIRKILAGDRSPGLLAGLDDEDTVIIDAVLRGLQNPETLPRLNTQPKAELAAPALAQLIHSAASGDPMALNMVATMAEQMTGTHGDMVLLGGAVSKMVQNDERDPAVLCKNMTEKGEKLVLDILQELTKLSAH